MGIVGWVVLLLVIVAALVVLAAWFYRRATNEVSLIRTGIGGRKVIVDGGVLAVPFFHEISRVNMQTIRMDVSRSGDRSLITKDRMRVDIEAEFFVRVVQKKEAVAAAGAGAEPQARDLTPYEGVRAFVFDVRRESPDRILVGLNRRDPSLFDAHWLDLETGELELVVENPGNFGGVVLDHELKARLAVGQGPAGETVFYTRPTEADAWSEVASYPAAENVSPLRFHPDDRRVYVNSNHGADFSRLALLDLETGEQEEVERDPLGRADLSGALFSDLTDELLATVYEGDTIRIYPKDEELAEDLARLREVHEGEPSVSSTTADERTFVVSFDHPRDPGATYLYDRDAKEATFLFRPRPWLLADVLADMEPVRFEARDGLEIPAYLTLPRGVEPGGATTPRPSCWPTAATRCCRSTTAAPPASARPSTTRR